MPEALTLNNTVCIYAFMSLRFHVRDSAMCVCCKNGVNVVFVPHLFPQYHIMLKAVEISIQLYYVYIILWCFSLLFSVFLIFSDAHLSLSLFVSVSLLLSVQVREEKRGEEGGKSSSAETEVRHSEWSWAREDERWEGKVGSFLEMRWLGFFVL